ncbi:MAG TPA: sugar ABC transporter substrate-binding protein [Candidatus Limnocylindrales bacterium]|nr:sugar ABC transporter substrate-binding protein [Candidatus Limnocylindrales bacterium]
MGFAILLTAIPATAVGQDDYVPERQGGIPGALLPDELSLWQYDAASASYQPVEGDATAPYVPNLRAFPEGTKIGFAEGLAAIPFSNAINRGIYKLADELGFEVVYCDNNYDPQLAVSCAETIVQQQPAFVVESNWQASAAESAMAIFNEAGIPVVSVDVLHPNAIFMGADNWTSGLLAGQGAGEHAKSLGRCGDVSLLLGVNPGEGAAANERLTGFADGVQTVCGPIPDDRIDTILTDQQTSEQSLTLATDWLTAHPDAGFVLSSTIDDARSDGVARALTQSGREGVAVGIGCDDIGIAATRIPVEEDHFLGCVAYFPERYPEYLISIAADVLEGQPVPQEVHIDHVFLDIDSIGDIYPAS